MNILVCISRVPDTATKITIGADGKSIDSKGIKFILNPYDELALEEGLRLREKNGGTVTALTFGISESIEILRNALAMGADNAVLIKGSESSDSYSVAANIANYAKKTNPDIILLGKQSVDFDSLQIPSLLAELLDLPSVAVVSKLTIDGTNVTAERDIEGGKDVVSTTLPCIISAQKGLNDPRYPKLPDIMKAKKKPIEELDATTFTPFTQILKMEIPLKERKAKIFGGTVEDIDKLVKLLHEEAKVI